MSPARHLFFRHCRLAVWLGVLGSWLGLLANGESSWFVRPWLGTSHEGLRHWFNGQATVLNPDSGLGGESIRALQTDRAGDLWISTESPSTVQRLHAGKVPRPPFTTTRSIQPTSPRCFSMTGWAGM